MTSAERKAFELVPETCPIIDKATETYLDVVKSQTEALRSALIDALEENERLENTIDDLESEIDDLNSQIEELENEQ